MSSRNVFILKTYKYTVSFPVPGVPMLPCKPAYLAFRWGVLGAGGAPGGRTDACRVRAAPQAFSQSAGAGVVVAVPE